MKKKTETIKKQIEALKGEIVEKIEKTTLDRSNLRFVVISNIEDQIDRLNSDKSAYTPEEWGVLIEKAEEQKQAAVEKLEELHKHENSLIKAYDMLACA